MSGLSNMMSQGGQQPQQMTPAGIGGFSAPPMMDRHAAAYLEWLMNGSKGEFSMPDSNIGLASSGGMRSSFLNGY